MKLIEADKVEQAIKDYWKAQVDKALTLTDGNEKRITIYLEHNHELLKAIDELPPAEPYTTTHDSIPAETGKNGEDRTSGDCISKTGRWIYGESEVGNDGYYCSECGNFVPWIYEESAMNFIREYKFCPNCGAKMDA